MFGMFPWQGGKLYEDPQARFTMVVDLSWEQVETDGRYAQFKVPDLPLNLYLLMLKAGTVDLLSDTFRVQQVERNRNG